MHFTLTNTPPKKSKPAPQPGTTRHAYVPKESKIQYVDPEPIHPDEEWFRHHNWKEKRAKVDAALQDARTSPRQLYNFQNCGADCIIEFNKEENRFRLRANYCKCRHCEPCMKAKANLLAANLRGRLEKNHRAKFRFVTLTLKHSHDPLKDQITRLHSCWKKLRADKLWKRSQRGGAAMLEIKWHAEACEWHPHLHIVTEGEYVNGHALSNAWLRATGDSFVVDIRLLRQPKDAAFYVAKYVTKGTNKEVWDNVAAAREWVTATKGVRTCATFGTWRGYKLLAKPPSKGTWVGIDLLRTVAARARQGHEDAIRMIDGIQEDFQYNPHKPRAKKRE